MGIYFDTANNELRIDNAGKKNRKYDDRCSRGQRLVNESLPFPLPFPASYPILYVETKENVIEI